MTKGFKRILVLPDLHCPFEHKHAFKFIDAVIKKYQPDHVIQLGDEIDGNQISFHEKDPDIPFSPSSELATAVMHLEQLYSIVPNAVVLESNHTSLFYRRSKYAGLPRSVLKSYSEILQAPPGWEWKFEYFCKMSNGRLVYCHHGHGRNALNNSKARAMNYIQGHHHSTFDLQYWSNGNKVYWGVTSGCLIDLESIAFSYGKNHLPKPILGCTVIIHGQPRLIPMVLDKQNNWIGKIL
mgnify:FL=1